MNTPINLWFSIPVGLISSCDLCCKLTIGK